MKVNLCATNKQAVISKESMTDIGIFNLVRGFADSKYSDDEIAAFFNTYLTYDPEEIRYRSTILGYLSGVNSCKEKLADIIAGCRRLLQSIKIIDDTFLRPLVAYTYKLRVLEEYMQTVEKTWQLFSGESDIPEITAISKMVQEQQQSQFYTQVQETVHQVRGMVERLDNVTLGVNFMDSGGEEPLRLGVVNVNSTSENIVGIFGHGGEKSNSLYDPAPVRVRGQLPHLEDFILADVEKKWARKLRAALRKLNKIDIDNIIRWHNWLKHIYLYYSGLLFADKIKPNEVFPPKPMDEAILSEGSFITAEEMLNPYMAITDRKPVQQNLRFNLGETVMITGANNSGKTTALKAFAQNCLLAQLGFWIPVRSFKFMTFKKWFTVFSAGEDDQFQASRFQQEAEQMRKAINHAESGDCLLLNEPFTSTNPVEAAELLRDVVVELNLKGVTLFFVTHNFEVYPLLNDIPTVQIRSYVTRVEIDGEKVKYQYVLEEKAPDGLSFARALAREYGLTIDNMINDPDNLQALEKFITEGNAYA